MKKEVDLAEKVIAVPFNAPISITFDQETNTLFIENAPYHANAPRLTMRAVFSAAAAQQLLASLKKIEAALKLTEDTLVDTNFLDKTDIL